MISTADQPAVAPADTGFVQTRGAEFCVDGRPFRYLGGNNYPLVQSNYSSAELDSFFVRCKAHHITVVRTWAFNQRTPATAQTGDFVRLEGRELVCNETTFRSLDRVLARARVAGVRLILVLQNQWGGSKAEWCLWSNARHGTACETKIGDDFHADPQVRGDFKEYLARFVTRTNAENGVPYRDDPTIFSWELINEGRYTGNEGALAETNPGSPASSRVRAMTAWYADLSAYLKTLDGHHLVGTGSVSQYADYTSSDPVHNGSYYGLDYKTQHELGSIDYFDFHLYPYGDAPGFGLRAYGQNTLGKDRSLPTREGLLAQLRQFVADAHAAGKPVTIGEYGVDRRNTSASGEYPAYPRAANFANFASDWFGLGGDGLTIWHFTDLFDDENYNVLPGNPHAVTVPGGKANDDDAELLRGLRDVLEHYAGELAH